MKSDTISIMKTQHEKVIGRLGSAKAEDQVRQAMANVTLEGLKPSKLSVKLAHSVASGKITTDEAVNQLISSYGCHA